MLRRIWSHSRFPCFRCICLLHVKDFSAASPRILRLRDVNESRGYCMSTGGGFEVLRTHHHSHHRGEQRAVGVGRRRRPWRSGSGSRCGWGTRWRWASFVVEAIIKMVALAPRSHRYFKDGWNVFDFIVIVAALIPTTGQFAVIARLARLLRALRLISAVKELRLIISALVRSIPSVGHVSMLMGVIVYIYAIMGYHFFHAHDPENWGSLGLSLLTLFNIITLEGWIEVMAVAMELNGYAWIYFVSFVVVGTFVVINMLIAVIINNLDEAKLERLRELEAPVTAEELMREIRTTRESLSRLESRLDRGGGFGEEDAGLEPGQAVAEDAGLPVVGEVFGVGAHGLDAVSEGGFGPGLGTSIGAVAPEFMGREDDVAVYGVAG